MLAPPQRPGQQRFLINEASRRAEEKLAASQVLTPSTYRVDRNLVLQGGLVPSKISGVGTNIGLLVHVLPGLNKQRAFKPSMLLS